MEYDSVSSVCTGLFSFHKPRKKTRSHGDDVAFAVGIGVLGIIWRVSTRLQKKLETPWVQTLALTNGDDSLKRLNHGLNVANKVKPRDNVELIGVNLMRKVAERTNDQVADGTSTSIILAHGLISEGVKAVTTGADRMETIKGVERTVRALVKELKPISRKVKDFVHVIKINTRNNDDIGLAVARAKSKVASEGVECGRLGNKENGGPGRVACWLSPPISIVCYR